jgi:hypothetical protein
LAQAWPSATRDEEAIVSSYAYGRITTQRAVKVSRNEDPGSSFLELIAALVPAEVLAAHAFMLTFTTETTGTGEDATAVITKPEILRWGFWGLVLAAMALFLAGRVGDLAKLDCLRVLIPPGAFWLWAMLQPISAFDALGLDWSPTVRGVVVLIGGLLLLAMAKALDPERPS